MTDAGPLIHLSWLNQVELLAQLFDTVLVPAAVRREVLTGRPDAPGLAALRQAFAADWMQTLAVPERALTDTMPASLHRGEIEAIALAQEQGAELLLLDDRVARNEARRRGLAISGTIGLLYDAKTRGIIPAVSPLLDELQSHGFWISDQLLGRIRREDQAAQ